MGFSIEQIARDPLLFIRDFAIPDLSKENERLLEDLLDYRFLAILKDPDTQTPLNVLVAFAAWLGIFVPNSAIFLLLPKGNRQRLRQMGELFIRIGKTFGEKFPEYFIPRDVRRRHSFKVFRSSSIFDGYIELNDPIFSTFEMIMIDGESFSEELGSTHLARSSCLSMMILDEAFAPITKALLEKLWTAAKPSLSTYSESYCVITGTTTDEAVARPNEFFWSICRGADAETNEFKLLSLSPGLVRDGEVWTHDDARKDQNP